MPDLAAIQTGHHARALRERDRFLSEHPELKSLQQRIDRMLGSAESLHNRLVLIHDMMMDSFLELDEKLQALARAKRDPETQGRLGSSK
jgi:hypothetical protein